MEKSVKMGRFPAEVRDRAVRLVLETEGDHASRWVTLVSVSGKIGCTAETLRRWVHEAEVDVGRRPGSSTDAAARIKALEREARLRAGWRPRAWAAGRSKPQAQRQLGPLKSKTGRPRRRMQSRRPRKRAPPTRTWLMRRAAKQGRQERRPPGHRARLDRQQAMASGKDRGRNRLGMPFPSSFLIRHPSAGRPDAKRHHMRDHPHRPAINAPLLAIGTAHGGSVRVRPLIDPFRRWRVWAARVG
jgi:transposase